MALLTPTTLVADAHKAALVVAHYRFDPVKEISSSTCLVSMVCFRISATPRSARGVCYGTNRNFHALKASVGQLTP
jgi:hypothetical protein